MTLLELFSRSAPTWFIPAWQLTRRGRGRRSAVAACAGRRRPAAGLRRLCFFILFGLLRRSNCDSENCLGDSTRDTRFHLFEEAVRLALVCDERILLAVATQVDSFAQLFHRGEVLDPVGVDRPEKDPPLDRAG